MTLDHIKDAIRTLRVNARSPGMVRVAGGWSTDGGPTSIGEAIRRAEAVLNAFPKMLEALEAERKNGNPRWNAIGAEFTPTCGQCGAPDEPTGQDHSDDCLLSVALRAAREALGPVTPPQRCTDTVTEWTDTEERTVPCNHPLPCPLHTPRAAREPVPAESAHEYVEWPRPEYLPADATLPDNHPCKVCCKPRSAHARAAVKP